MSYSLIGLLHTFMNASIITYPPRPVLPVSIPHRPELYRGVLHHREGPGPRRLGRLACGLRGHDGPSARPEELLD